MPEIGRAILKTALARATAGTEGARFVGAQLTGSAATNVQALLEFLKNAIDGKAATSHSHGIGDLPVATSGTVSTTQVPRADDSRLSDPRTPTDNSITNAKVQAGAAIEKAKLAALALVDADLATGRHLPLTVADAAARPATARIGKILYQADTKESLKNTGTEAAPVWSAFGGGGGGAAEYAIVKRGAAQSTTSGQWNPIDWDTETADPNGWFDPLNPRRITLPAGVFSVQAGSCFAANATGLRSMRIEHYNSAGTLLALYEAQVVSAGVDANGRAFPPGFIATSAGDFLQGAAFQNSGGALNFVAPAGFPVPHLTVWRVK